VTVQWTSNARRRLGGIHAYIAADAPERATAFCEGLIEAAEQLGAHPFLGAILPEDAAYRQLVVQNYRIVYRLGEDTVYVMTIMAPGMQVTPERLSQ
jgi:plasmid stabilization system protein ParE